MFLATTRITALCLVFGACAVANPWREVSQEYIHQWREEHAKEENSRSGNETPNTFPRLAHSDEDLGIVNVAMPPFSADPSGQKDATQALQSAIEYGRAHRLTIYVPLGRYKVSDTLNCTEHARGRLNPVIIVGQKAKTSEYGPLQAPNRPEFFLPDNTPGFMEASKPKYVVHFWEDSSLPSATGEKRLKKANKERVAVDSDVRTSVNFNQIIQGINVVVGEGNRGAIGIRLRGAQGSAIQDCLVDLGKDGFIGVVGACGSGGGHAGVTVVGGKYGLDFRMAQPAPSITGATLYNQSCSSLIYSGLQTLTAVGIRIFASKRADSVTETLGVIASVPPEVLNETSPWLPPAGLECALPDLPPNNQPSEGPLSGQISLIDAVIEKDEPCDMCMAITSPRDLYLKNVYIRDFSYLLRLRTAKGGDTKVPNNSPAKAWTRIDEAAYTVQPPSMTKEYRHGLLKLQFESTIWIDGQKSATNQTHFTFSAPEPEEDIVSRHLWDEATFPSFQSESAVSVTMPPYNAKGDGRHDDTAAIQTAIDEHDIVVLPRGSYQIGKTLQLRQNTSLVGVGRPRTTIMPSAKGLEGQASSPQPLLATYKGQGANIVAFLTIVNWNNLNNTYAFLWQVYGIRDCVWRQAFAFTATDWRSIAYHSRHQRKNAQPRSTIVNATLPLMVITGGGKFYNLENEDWLHESPSYRHLLVTNSSGGLRFYQLNTEHTRGNANTEIANSANVEIFGMKSEGNFVIIWLRNVENVTLYGYGGGADAYPLTYKYPPGYAQYSPSLFRVENAKNTRLIHLNDYGRIQGGNSTHLTGQGFDPHLWSMVLKVDGQISTPPMDRPVLYLIN